MSCINPNDPKFKELEKKYGYFIARKYFSQYDEEAERAYPKAEDWVESNMTDAEKMSMQTPMDKVEDKIISDNNKRIEELQRTYPQEEQEKTYDCGPSVIYSTLKYFDITQNYPDLIKELKTNTSKGTEIENMVKVLNKNNIPSQFKKNMTEDDLIKSVSAGIPVVLAIQYNSSAEATDLTKSYDQGHYVTVIGYKDGVFTIDNPALKQKQELTTEKLTSVWRGIDNKGKNYDRGGIIMQDKNDYIVPSKSQLGQMLGLTASKKFNSEREIVDYINNKIGRKAPKGLSTAERDAYMLSQKTIVPLDVKDIDLYTASMRNYKAKDGAYKFRSSERVTNKEALQRANDLRADMIKQGIDERFIYNIIHKEGTDLYVVALKEPYLLAKEYGLSELQQEELEHNAERAINHHIDKYAVGEQMEMAFDNAPEDKQISYFRPDNPETLSGNVYDELVPTSLDTSKLPNVRGNEIVRKVNETLSDATGTEFQVVNKEQAMEINPKWTNEPAFYMGNKVYFVGDHVTTEASFHEFGHPIIKSLRVGNRTLFDSLYADLEKTPEGQELIEKVKAAHPELLDNPDLLKEEIITTALGKKAELNYNKIKASTGFKKFIDNLLYHVKQLLRKVFGQKIDISKLSEDTKLDQFAEWLARGEKFDLETLPVDEKDVVQYLRKYDEETRKLAAGSILGLGHKNMMELTNKGFDIITRQLQLFRTNKNYSELAKVLTDEFDRGELYDMKRNIEPYKRALESKASRLHDNIELAREHSLALVNTLYKLHAMVTKINEHVESIETETDNRSNLYQLSYYKHFLNYWGNYMEMAKGMNIPINTPLADTVNSIHDIINKTTDTIHEHFLPGIRDIITEELTLQNQAIKDKYEEMIVSAKKRNAPKSYIDKLNKEYYGLTEEDYKRMRSLAVGYKTGSLSYDESQLYEKLMRESKNGFEISKDKIEWALKGKLGDANAFNSFFEGYMYNTDPIVGGFALFVKNALTEVMTTTQAKYTQFVKELKPLTDAAGISFHNIGQLGKDIGFIDTVGTIDQETKEFKKHQVWTLLNPFKDYRYFADEYENKLQDAKIQYAKTNLEEDRKKIVLLSREHDKVKRAWMHQEYKPEFYEKDDLFYKDDIGAEAKDRVDAFFNKMRNLTEPTVSKIDKFNISDELDAMWREYRQMHSLYDEFGNKKEGLELDISNRLREYRTKSSNLYEFVERSGEFQKDLWDFEQELIDSGKASGSPAFRLARQAWIDKNTKTSIKAEFYLARKALLDEMKSITNKLPQEMRKQMDFSEVYDDINSIVAPYKDSDLQVMATEMTPESIARIKTLQEKMEDAKRKFAGFSGLTTEEMDRYKELSSYEESGNLDPDDENELYMLHNKFKSGLSRVDRNRFIKLLDDLHSLQSKTPTKYFLDILNKHIEGMDLTNLHKTLNIKEFNESTVQFLYGGKTEESLELAKSILNDFFKQSPEFKIWWEKNHYKTERTIIADTMVPTRGADGNYYKQSKKTYERIPVDERINVWSVITPNDDNYYNKTKLLDRDGNVVDTINRVADTKYSNRVVKDIYRTFPRGMTYQERQKYIGRYIDNQGRFLPKSPQDLKPGEVSPFHNQAYFDLKSTNPKLFAVLEKLTEHHLKNQEGLSYRSKLYLDFPRFRKSSLEVMQSKDYMNNKISRITESMKRIREFWKLAKDAPESDFNYKDNFNLVRTDMFDDEISGVPIHGLYKFDIDRVSTDIITSMSEYMLSAERQKKLVQIHPVAQALRAVINDDKNKIKDFDKVNKWNLIHRGVMNYANKKGKNIREWAVNNFIEREFEGVKQKGFTKDSAFLNNLGSFLFKRAAFSFFALNIPSALKNAFGAKFQTAIEATAGKYITPATSAKGEALAVKTQFEVSNQVYSQKPFSLNVQLADLFEAVNGRYEEKFGMFFTRTLGKDTASGTWLYNFRKWMEDQASLQIFFSQMYTIKVEQNGKMIDYVDAWELKDDKIRLKEGIDPSYGVTYDEKGNATVGEKFKFYKNQLGQVQNNLWGAFAKFDQPEGQRYLAFRFLSFLRRHFTPMFVNRFGFSGNILNPRPRLNIGLGDVHEGTYITTLKLLGKTVREMGRNLPHMEADEKRAGMRVLSEVGLLLLMPMAEGLFFGWNPDDDDKYKKLREKSGPLPTPFTADSEYDFHLGGFLENHTLKLMMDLKSESEQFLPIPGMGLSSYANMVDIKSIAFAPTLHVYAKLIQDMLNIAEHNNSGYYHTPAGPFKWQEKDDPKVWNHMGQAVGVSGSQIDAVNSIKNFQSTLSRN